MNSLHSIQVLNELQSDQYYFITPIETSYDMQEHRELGNNLLLGLRQEHRVTTGERTFIFLPERLE